MTARRSRRSHAPARAHANPPVPTSGRLFELQQSLAEVLHYSDEISPPSERAPSSLRFRHPRQGVLTVGPTLWMRRREKDWLVDALLDAALRYEYVGQFADNELRFYDKHRPYRNPASVSDLDAARARLRPNAPPRKPMVGDRIVVQFNYVPFEVVVTRVNKKSLTVKDAKRRTWNVPLREPR